MYIPQCATLSLLHHQTNGLLIAFKIPFHGAEYAKLGLHAVQLGGQHTQLLCQIIPLFGAAALTEIVAADGIVGGGHILLCLFQFFIAAVQIFLGLLQPISTGAQVVLQLVHTLGALLHAPFQTTDIRLPTGNIRRQRGLFGPQLQELLGHALRVGSHSRQLLLQK